MRRRLDFALGFLVASVANVCGQEIVPESQPPANPPGRIIDENTGLRNLIYNLSAIDYIPFSLSINQSTSFGDNVQGLPPGTFLPSPGVPSLGDMYSATNFAGSSKVLLGEQLLFANAGYGLTRYVRDFKLNANNDFRDAGVNWHLTSRCSGDLVAAMVSSQSSGLGTTVPGTVSAPAPPPVQGQTNTNSATLANQVNTVSTKSADERARCQISGHISAILDSGWGRITNSLPPSAPSNTLATNPFATSDRLQRYVRGGLEYDVAGLNTLGLQATYVDRDFLGRSMNPGLAQVTNQTNYELTYRRLFAPNIEFKADIGLADILGLYTSSIPPTASRLEFIYTTSLHYAATPKISFGLAASHLITAPVGGSSDLSISDAQSLSLSYAFSPVLSFTGTISRGVANSPTLTPICPPICPPGTPPPPPGTPPPASLLFLNSTTMAGTVSASYRLSPFVNATASYSHTATEGGGLRATSNLFMFGLSYAGHGVFQDGLSGRPTP